MRTTIRLQMTFDGPFNVGAGALGGTLADKPLTRDSKGLPMVPASAFKGRLRHEVERLVPHLRNHQPCHAPIPESMCQGNDPPCLVCQLFGSPWQIGKLIFSDLTLVQPEFLITGHAAPPGELRPGVGLSRYRKVAEDQLFYTTEVFAPGTPITLEGTITGNLDQEDIDLLRNGLDSLFTVGGGKTSGLGWFDLNIDIQTHDDPASIAPIRLELTEKRDQELVVIVKLASPLLLGTDSDEAYYKTTRDYIPGRVLRGSLARLLLTHCDHDARGPHASCDFGQLFGDDAAVIFENLYPAPAREYAFPAPLSARSCKYHPGFKESKRPEEEGHGVGDILIRQAVYEQVLGNSKATLPFLYKPLCPECRAEVDSFTSSLVMLQLDNSSSNARLQFDDVSLPVRRTSHTAINRYRSVAADGQLYIEEIIDPLDKYGGTTTFRGSIRATAKQAAILNYWLPQLPALGHSPSRGLGKVQIEAVPAAKVDNPLPELSERIKKFNQLLRQEWEFYQRVAGIDSLPNDTLYFSVTLLSPTSLTWQGLPATAPHPEMLGFDDKVTLERAFANHHMVGGWHMGAGLPRRTQLVIDMGSVFLYRSEHLSLEALATHLLELEATGLGNRALRQQGLGQIAVCFPFHYQAEVSL